MTRPTPTTPAAAPAAPAPEHRPGRTYEQAADVALCRVQRELRMAKREAARRGDHARVDAILAAQNAVAAAHVLVLGL